MARICIEERVRPENHYEMSIDEEEEKHVESIGFVDRYRNGARCTQTKSTTCTGGAPSWTDGPQLPARVADTL